MASGLDELGSLWVFVVLSGSGGQARYSDHGPATIQGRIGMSRLARRDLRPHQHEKQREDVAKYLESTCAFHLFARSAHAARRKYS